MAEPVFTNHPVEYFGHAYIDHSDLAKKNQSAQHCPFLDSECKKPRKSEPHIKVGICTIGYKPQFLDQRVPVVICPYRYHIQTLFDYLATHYLPTDHNSLIRWAPEVDLGLGGSVDFVMARCKKTSPSTIDDFICIEFQAAGTTGTPWKAVQEFQASRRFASTSYPYGINWANEFAKTMMQQVYKKGMVIGSWNKRIIFVLQDVGMTYLRESYDVSGLHDPIEAADPIQFFTVKMEWKDSDKVWSPVPSEIVSTDLEGVRKILAGSASGEYITLDKFVANITRRLR